VMQMLERFSKQKQKDLSEYSENNESWLAQFLDSNI
jgi:hypothetical protein